MSVIIQECSECGTHYFPDRLLCGSCNSNSFSERVVTESVVEEFTQIAAGDCLATVRLLGELAVIATLIDVEPRRGLTVPVEATRASATGHAYLPGARTSDSRPNSAGTTIEEKK